MDSQQYLSDNHAGLLMIEDYKGGHPNMFTIGYFILLIVAMSVNLFLFYRFQYAQEKLAGVILDIETTHKNKDEGVVLVIEEE